MSSENWFCLECAIDVAGSNEKCPRCLSPSPACSADYEPRRDDAEPLSDDWFREVWPEEHRKDCYAIECDSGCWFEVGLYGDNCFCWSVNGHSWDGENFKTRGDVRKFLWYMQAELIP